MNPEIYDYPRGIQGGHKCASENVLVLKDCSNRKGEKMKIVVKTIIMGYNAEEILPLVEWVEKNGFDEIRLQPLERNLESRDDPQWFKRAPFWPKGKEVNESPRLWTG